MPVQFHDFIVPGALVCDLAASTKAEALGGLVDALVAAGALHPDRGAPAMQALLARERISATAVGGGAAIPHAKCPGVPRLMGAVGHCRAGVPFGAGDDEPVRLFFLLLSGQEDSARHLEALAHISRCLRDTLFHRFLANARSPQEMRDVLETADRRSFGARSG